MKLFRLLLSADSLALFVSFSSASVPRHTITVTPKLNPEDLSTQGVPVKEVITRAVPGAKSLRLERAVVELILPGNSKVVQYVSQCSFDWANGKLAMIESMGGPMPLADALAVARNVHARCNLPTGKLDAWAADPRTTSGDGVTFEFARGDCAPVIYFGIRNSGLPTHPCIFNIRLGWSTSEPPGRSLPPPFAQGTQLNLNPPSGNLYTYEEVMSSVNATNAVGQVERETPKKKKWLVGNEFTTRSRWRLRENLVAVARRWCLRFRADSVMVEAAEVVGLLR